MVERYINPHTDFGFYRLFGSESNKDLLKSFLNAIFHDEQNVQDVTYLNSEQFDDHIDACRAVFDVYCENDRGEKFIVEIQNVYHEFYKNHTIYYSTFPIREQAQRGDDWDFHLNSVYTIGLLNFNFADGLDDAQRWHHEVKLMEVDTKEVFYDKLTYVYVEIPKFDKTESELVGIDPSYEYRILFKKKQRVADDEVYMEAGKHYIMSGACAPKYDEGQEYSFIINNNSSLLTKVSGPLYQLSNINRLGPTPHAALYDLMVHPSGNAYDHSETHEMAGGNMYHLTADTKFYGFRAYIQETDAEGVPLNAQQSPSRLSMRITDEGGQTTDISTVETDGTAARTVHAPAIYDLTGRAVRLGTTSTDGRPKGIYIVDGRKTVVR